MKVTGLKDERARSGLVLAAAAVGFQILTLSHIWR